MKPSWMVIAAITLGATFALTARITTYAREADTPQDSWTRNSVAMTRLYGADWYERMMVCYRTNYTEWQGMKHSYLHVIGRQ